MEGRREVCEGLAQGRQGGPCPGLRLPPTPGRGLGEQAARQELPEAERQREESCFLSPAQTSLISPDATITGREGVSGPLVPIPAGISHQGGV